MEEQSKMDFHVIKKEGNVRNKRGWDSWKFPLSLCTLDEQSNKRENRSASVKTKGNAGVVWQRL